MTIRGDKLAIRVEADLANLSAISSQVSEAMRQATIDAAIIRKVLLAIDEACTNIALYAYPGVKGFIRITCWLDHDDLMICIEDQGRPFNPCSVPGPEVDVSLDERKVGGLGVHFMRESMDEISYKYDPEKGNQLTMRKHIAGHR
jgi:serine/threonine-protein kinase RsbW